MAAWKRLRPRRYKLSRRLRSSCGSRTQPQPQGMQTPRPGRVQGRGFIPARPIMVGAMLGLLWLVPVAAAASTATSECSDCPTDRGNCVDGQCRCISVFQGDGCRDDSLLANPMFHVLRGFVVATSGAVALVALLRARSMIQHSAQASVRSCLVVVMTAAAAVLRITLFTATSSLRLAHDSDPPVLAVVLNSAHDATAACLVAAFVFFLAIWIHIAQSACIGGAQSPTSRLHQILFTSPHSSLRLASLLLPQLLLLVWRDAWSVHPLLLQTLLLLDWIILQLWISAATMLTKDTLMSFPVENAVLIHKIMTYNYSTRTSFILGVPAFVFLRLFLALSPPDAVSGLVRWLLLTMLDQALMLRYAYALLNFVRPVTAKRRELARSHLERVESATQKAWWHRDVAQVGKGVVTVHPLQAIPEIIKRPRTLLRRGIASRTASVASFVSSSIGSVHWSHRSVISMRSGETSSSGTSAPSSPSALRSPRARPTLLTPTPAWGSGRTGSECSGAAPIVTPAAAATAPWPSPRSIPTPMWSFTPIDPPGPRGTAGIAMQRRFSLNDSSGGSGSDGDIISPRRPSALSSNMSPGRRASLVRHGVRREDARVLPEAEAMPRPMPVVSATSQPTMSPCSVDSLTYKDCDAACDDDGAGGGEHAGCHDADTIDAAAGPFVTAPGAVS